MSKSKKSKTGLQYFAKVKGQRGYLAFNVEECETCGGTTQAANAVNLHETAKKLQSLGMTKWDGSLPPEAWYDDESNQCKCELCDVDEPTKEETMTTTKKTNSKSKKTSSKKTAKSNPNFHKGALKAHVVRAIFAGETSIVREVDEDGVIKTVFAELVETYENLKIKKGKKQWTLLVA